MAFVRHAAVWLVVAIAGGLFLSRLADSLAHRLAGIFQMILVSLFLSFAIEPAVGYLARRGWRRGAATGLIFLAVVAAGAGLLALLIPAILTGTRQLISSLPDLVANLARYLKPLGIQLDRASLQQQLTTYGDDLISAAQHVTGGILTLATGVAGVLFEVSAVAFFTFYMVARGPQLRRAVLSWFRPRHQRQILAVWEDAIQQTGGYFYSRLLLAVVNGSLMFVVLWVRHVPFAAPLAVFEAAVSTFIPVVGTYIGGAAPVLAALLTDPVDAIIVLAWIVVYQQIENYFLAPRLTARDHVRVRSPGLRGCHGRRRAGRLPVRIPGPAGGRHHPVSSADPRPPVQGHRQCRGQRRRWKRVNPSEARQTSPPHPGIISSAAPPSTPG